MSKSKQISACFWRFDYTTAKQEEKMLKGDNLVRRSSNVYWLVAMPRGISINAKKSLVFHAFFSRSLSVFLAQHIFTMCKHAKSISWFTGSVLPNSKFETRNRDDYYYIDYNVEYRTPPTFMTILYRRSSFSVRFR